MDVSVPKFDIRINPEYLERDAVHIVRYVKPDWPKDAICCKIFTDGITNRLIGLYLTDDKDNMILFRVYGEKTDLFIDRTLELRNMRIMHKAGLSAPIYCTFANGIAYGFSAGTVLDERSVRHPSIAPLVAHNLALMHTLRPAVVHHSDHVQPCLFPGLRKFLSLCDSSVIATNTPHPRSSNVCDLEKLRQEVSFLEKELPKLRSPIVFCHNDLLLKNIIYHEPANDVNFIDFEYSDYNYQAFDIANHFVEFCGVDPFDPSLYPDRQFQITWLRTYLQKWFSLSGNGCIPSDLDDQVDTLYETVNKFKLAAHLYWGLWALVQSVNSSIDFDYLVFATKRLEEYFKRKNELFLAVELNHNNQNY